MRNVTVVQQMIDWIEENMEDGPTLQKVSDAVGYSPWYCSCMFHDITGMTMKSYVSKRRLARATEEIRDTKERILDIADKIIIISGGEIKTIGSKEEVLPHLSEIYSTCTVLEEAQ